MFRHGWILTLAFGVMLAATVAAAAEPQPAPDYLPLVMGKRWVLRSAAAEKPVVLEVVGRDGDAYRVKWDNPWSSTELYIVPREGRYFVSAIVMNGQVARLPEQALYWDPTAADGASWSNGIGTMTVLSRSMVVDTKVGKFKDCIQIGEKSKSGSQLYWTFAPGVGFVQFGEGEWAFRLEEQGGDGQTPPAGAKASPPPPTPTPIGKVRIGAVHLGLSATIAANEAYTPANAARRFRQSLEAGVNFLNLSPKWNEVEREPGSFNFDDVDFWMEQAVAHEIDVAINLRVVDTNQRTMPADLRHRDFDDPLVRDRLLALIDAIAPRFKGRVKWVMIGNEIDPYFGAHPGEVAAYLTLYRAAADRLKQRLPGVAVGTTFTFGGLPLDGSLAALRDAGDFFSITYYPLNPDFSMRPPTDVPGDFARMRTAAAGKQILIQEFGYATAAECGSSPERQAAFIDAVFDELSAHAPAYLAANFLFMSDLAESLVEGFGGYYDLKNSTSFKAFLRTLGLFDGIGQAKPGWTTFRERGRRLQDSPSPVR